jgi:LysM repeat protein
MANRMTEPLKRYKSDDIDLEGWDDEEDFEEDIGASDILWGRVALLAGILLVAFFLGRLTGGGGVPAGDLAAANDRIETLEGQNQALKTELAAEPSLFDGTDEGVSEEGVKVPEPDPAKADETTTEAAPKLSGDTYIVQSGDTLAGIAQKFYKDASLGVFLAEANQLSNPGKLSLGQRILIPPKPKG